MTKEKRIDQRRNREIHNEREEDRFNEKQLHNEYVHMYMNSSSNPKILLRVMLDSIESFAHIWLNWLNSCVKKKKRAGAFTL